MSSNPYLHTCRKVGCASRHVGLDDGYSRVGLMLYLEEGFQERDERPKQWPLGLLIDEELSSANAPVSIHRNVHIHPFNCCALRS